MSMLVRSCMEGPLQAFLRAWRLCPRPCPASDCHHSLAGSPLSVWKAQVGYFEEPVASAPRAGMLRFVPELGKWTSIFLLFILVSPGWKTVARANVCEHGFPSLARFIY